MLKVLIADDEHIIKNGIENSIDWEKIGMQVIATADNGREAYKIAIEKRPDIIITDIRMPFMDGLEFIEKVKEIHKDAYIIFISGHDEFIYAKTAIRLGAYDFIVKPIDLDYLKEILKKINIEYHKRNNEVKVLDLKLDREQIGQDLLARLLFSSCEKNTIIDRLEELGIERGSKCFCVIFQIDYFEMQESRQEKTQKFVDEVMFYTKQLSKFKNNILLPDTKKGRIVLASFIDENKDFELEVQNFVDEMRGRVNIADTDTFSICIGNLHADVQGIITSYNEAVETSNYSYVYGGDKNVFFSQYQSFLKDRNSDLNDDMYTFLTSIRSLNKDIIKKNLNIIKEMIIQSGANSIFYVKIIINSVYCMLNETLHDLQVSLNDIFENPIERYKKIIHSCSIDDEFDQLFEFVSEICDYMNNKKDVSYNTFIEEAKMYINNNFSKSTLCLEDVAKNSNISPSYLSTLFKQYVKKPFISYLTDVRIEKAKEMLIYSQLKTYKICSSVGYDNPTYFSTVFKKRTGKTPTEFRNAYKNQS